MKKAHHLLILTALVFGLARATPPPFSDEKNPRKKFGSSLKTLKWDAQERRAVDREDGPLEIRKGDGESQSVDEIKLETPLVTFDVTVLDRSTSRVVAGLRKEDFVFIEKGSRQPVVTFATGNESSGPRAIIIVIDYSPSVSAYFDVSIKAARNLIERLPSKDSISIVTDDVQLLSGPTSDKMAAIEALDGLRIRFRDHHRGQSRQYSALFAALRELVTSGHERTIIVFQTDGDEVAKLRDSARAGAYGASPEFGFRDVETAAEKAGVTIYGLVPGERIVGVPYAELRKIAERAKSRAREVDRNLPLEDNWIDLILPGQTATEHIVALTGGTTWYLTQPNQAEGIISEILDEINRRYFLGYFPGALAADGQRHQVEIQIRDHPDYSVRGQLTYYAPTPRSAPSIKR